MNHSSLYMAVRYSVTLAPFVLPTIMFIATRRAVARAKKIKWRALNEDIPFAEFAAAELRVRRYAFATFVLALLGAIGLAAMLVPSSGPVRKARNLDDDVDEPAPSMTSRDIIPDRPVQLKPNDIVDNPP